VAPVTFTAEASDRYSGIASLAWQQSADGGATWTTVGSGLTQAVASQGETLVRVSATDVAGNVSAWSDVDAGSTARIDTGSPTLTAGGGSTAWQSVASVAVTATPSDTTSSVTVHRATSIDDGVTWSAWSAGATATVTAEGQTLVKFRATDAAGNQAEHGPTSATTVRIDRTAPSAPTVIGGSSAWQQVASVTVTGSGSSDPRGPVTYEHRTSTDGTTWSAPAAGASVAISAQGTTFVQLRAIDAVGNATVWAPASGTAAGTVRIDRTPPATPTISGVASGWVAATSVTAVASSSEDLSGLAAWQSETSTDGATWGDAQAGDWRTVTTEGATHVRFRAQNGAGAWSDWATMPVRIDRSIATGTLAVPDTLAGTVTLDGTHADQLSGVASWELVFESPTNGATHTFCAASTGGSPWSCAGIDTTSVTDGAWEVRLVVTDAAGNTATVASAPTTVANAA
jgi:hypothetical protein